MATPARIDGVHEAFRVSCRIVKHERAIKKELVNTESVFHVWSADPESPANRARFNEHEVRTQLEAKLGRAYGTVVAEIAKRSAKARYYAARKQYHDATKAYEAMQADGMMHAQIVATCVTNPNAEASLMELIAMKLNDRELDVYAYARDRSRSHSEAVAILWRNRDDGIEAIELDGTVYAISLPADFASYGEPNNERWKWAWEKMLREQHPALTVSAFKLEFTEQQPTALDVLIAPSPLVMLVWM